MKPPFIEFETSEGAAESGPSYDDIAAQSLAQEAPLAEEAAPVEEAAVEETPAADEPPAWFKQYMERADPLLNAVAEAIQPEPPQPQPQVDLSQLDMQNPEHVAWLVNYQIKQAMSPYEPILGTTAEQQGREVANKFFDHVQEEVGAFDRDQALIAYQALMAENPGAEPERVLDYAARQVASYEGRVRQEAVDAYKAQQAAEDEKLQALAGAKNQPSTGTGSAVENEEMPTGRDKYEILAERWDARQKTSGLGV